MLCRDQEERAERVAQRRPPPKPCVSLAEKTQLKQRPHPAASEQQSGSTTVLMALKVFSEISLSCVVLLCTVFSKLSLVGLASHLGDVQRMVNNGSGADTATISKGVSLYWQLLLILLVPNCITFLRCLLFGFVGKSGRSFPFPRRSAFVAVCAWGEMCMQHVM